MTVTGNKLEEALEFICLSAKIHFSYFLLFIYSFSFKLKMTPAQIYMNLK